jgi:hypothetical protein
VLPELATWQDVAPGEHVAGDCGDGDSVERRRWVVSAIQEVMLTYVPGHDSEM